jgi:hypothetical protein
MDGAHHRRASFRYTSFTIAMMTPARTKTTIAICIQIQVGDTARN